MPLLKFITNFSDWALALAKDTEVVLINFNFFVYHKNVIYNYLHILAGVKEHSVQCSKHKTLV